jgi:hypothetical protein
MTLPRALACLLATVMVSVLVFVVRQGPWLGGSKERPPHGSDEIARMRAELNDLKQSVRVSEGFARAAVQSVAPSRAVDPRGRPVTPEGEPRPGATGRRGPDENEISKRLERRFADEKPDPAWSKGAQSLITEHVQKGVPPESKVGSIECRRTVCRVQSQHPNLDVYKKFVDDAVLFPHGGWNGPVMTSIVSRQPEIKAYAYLFREGENLEQMLTEESPL